MMTFHASSYHWTLALVLMTLTFIDGEEALNPHLQVGCGVPTLY